MAALDFDATNVPTDVVASLNLVNGRSYTGQNVSTIATLFARESATAVTPGTRSFRVEAGGDFQLDISVDPIYLWTDDPDGCPVIFDEVV